MRLGFFDMDPKLHPFGNLGPLNVCTEEHQELALDVAKQGIVLLDNKGALSLSKNTTKNFIVIGPNGNAIVAMISIYAGIPSEYTTPLQGLQKYILFVTYTVGCPFMNCTDELLVGLATKAATTTDVVVLVMGLDQSIEQEDLDWENLILLGYQEKCVKDMANATNGTMILVIMSISPIDISFAKNERKVRGILWVGYPGQAGGDAIAQVICGDHNPVPKKSSLNPIGFPSVYPSKQDPYPNGQAIDVSSVNCINLQLVLVIGVRNNRPMNGDHVVLIF
uniref:Glycosyl hydrolase family 3 family protein n=1 Tax=Populus alba TaxID=43335 RepID=A0A4U5QHY8_POPAL|nr:glycosyl hydrolase family 3 family protein [Populus alba]